MCVCVCVCVCAYATLLAELPMSLRVIVTETESTHAPPFTRTHTRLLYDRSHDITPGSCDDHVILTGSLGSIQEEVSKVHSQETPVKLPSHSHTPLAQLP